jgi:anion-transporting  ArsA/GET3 family ATPase
MQTGFRNRADEVIDLLHGEKTRFVLVASPRVDTIDEARFFADRLVEKDLGVAAIIVNRATPDFGIPDGQRPRAAQKARLYDNQAELHALAAAERDDVAPLVASTGREPTWVPLLPGDVHDLEVLDQIRSLLFQ